MEESVNRLEVIFKEDVYPQFQKKFVSVDEYIDSVSEYMEGSLLIPFLQGLKGKTVNEIRQIVLLNRNLGRYNKVLLSVLLRFFHEQDERQGQRPRLVICAHPKRVVVGDWY